MVKSIPVIPQDAQRRLDDGCVPPTKAENMSAYPCTAYGRDNKNIPNTRRIGTTRICATSPRRRDRKTIPVACCYTCQAWSCCHPISLGSPITVGTSGYIAPPHHSQLISQHNNGCCLTKLLPQWSRRYAHG